MLLMLRERYSAACLNIRMTRGLLSAEKTRPFLAVGLSLPSGKNLFRVP